MRAKNRIYPLSRLFQNLFPPWDKRRYIVVMEAYGDRAQFGGTGFYGVAALLAPVNDWTRLQSRWRQALHVFDPSLDVFHMTDFMTGAKPYRGRPRKDRALLMDKLLRAICDYVKFGYACVLLPDAQKALIELNAELGTRSLGDNFYALCADGCIGKISWRLDDIGQTQRVGYIFESGDEGLGNFRHTVEVIHSRSQLYRDEMKINSITTLAKKCAPAVQTPDILAYGVTHCRADQLAEHERPDYLQRLCASVPVIVDYLDENFVRTATAQYTEGVISRLIREHNLRPKQRKRRSKRSNRSSSSGGDASDTSSPARQSPPSEQQ